MSGFITSAVISLPRKNAHPLVIQKRHNESDKAFMRRCRKFMAHQDKETLLNREVTKKGFKSNQLIYLDAAEVDVTEKARTLYAK